MMTRNRVVVAAIVGAAALALIYASGFGETKESPSVDAEGARKAPPAPPEHRDSSRTPKNRPESEPAGEVEAPPSPPPRAEPERAQLRETLQHKYGRTAAGQDDGDEAQPASPPPSWTSLPEKYVAGIIREQLIPEAQSCYEDLAPKGTNGTMRFSVTVIGDAEIGGIIDGVDINQDETSLEGEFTECVRQAAYKMEFEPPEQGQGVQEFDFSMRFSADEKPK